MVSYPIELCNAASPVRDRLVRIHVELQATRAALWAVIDRLDRLELLSGLPFEEYESVYSRALADEVARLKDGKCDLSYIDGFIERIKNGR